MFSNRIALLAAVLASSASVAMAQVSVIPILVAAVAQNGKVLMVDNASHVLLIDNASRLCEAGGC